MSRTSMVKGGKVTAGGVNNATGKKNGTGAFTPYDASTHSYNEAATVNYVNPKDEKNTAKGTFELIQAQQNAPIQTTTAMRKDAMDNSAKFDQMQAGSKMYDEKSKADQAMQAQQDAENTATAGKGADATGSKLVVEDPYEGLDDEQTQTRKDAESQIAGIQATNTRLERYADDATRDLIAATQQIYGARIKKMEDTNKRMDKFKNTANIRSGRAQYTPEHAENILTDEEIDGNARVGELEGEMLKLIASANQERAKGKMSSFNEMFKNIQSIREEMNSQIQQNFENAQAKDKAITDKEKEARAAAKDAQTQSLELSKRSAPALAAKMKEFKTDEDRIAFLDAYAERTGVDPDVLLGDIETATKDNEKDALDIENIKNQIYNRNRAESRQQQKANEDKNKEDDIEPTTKNVIKGITAIDELTGSEGEKVKADLRDLGYYDDTPPQWYEEMIKDQVGNASFDIDTEWNKYRKSIVG